MAGELTTDFGALIRGVGVKFNEVISQNQQAYTPSFEPVVKTISDTNRAYNASGITGVGRLLKFSEGASIPKASRYKLYDTQMVHGQYGKQVEVSRLQLINRDFNEAFNEFNALTVGAKVTKSAAPAQIFNAAFGTTVSVGGIDVTTYNDGKPLCSTLHPRVDGGTAQSNASSTGISLTEANVETARVALLLQLQDDGTPITITGSLYLVVPTHLEKTATIITSSDKRSGGPDNDANIYSGGNMNVLASHWMDSGVSGTGVGSNTAWFLVAPSVAQLRLVLRTDMDLSQSVDRNTKSALFDLVLDFSVGSIDYRGVWGTKGDGLAYAS